MTYSTLVATLLAGGIEEAKEEATLLFAHFGNVKPATLLVEDPDVISPLLDTALEKRLEGTPLAYLIGEVGFYRESYRVSPACLIPRPDTEILVEEAISRLPRGARFADFCTGSGCVAISTLAGRTDTVADAYDISEDALALAAENGVRNGVEKRLHLHHTDLLTSTLPLAWDAILSNPPYIRRDVIDTLSKEVQQEPRIALDGGEDGLVFYQDILSKYNACPLILFEIGYDQGEAITALGESYGYTVTIRKDYGGNPRCAILEHK